MGARIIPPAGISSVSADTTPTLSANLDANDNQIINAKTVTFKDEHPIGNSGASKTVNWNDGQNQTMTLTADCTVSFTPPTSSDVGTFKLTLIQDSTGSWGVTWPGTVKWRGGTAPTITTTLTTGTDVIAFYYNGTDYKGVAAQDFQ